MTNTTLTDLTSILTSLAGPAGMLAWMVAVSNWFRNATETREDGTKLVTLSGTWLQVVVAAASIIPPAAAFLILTLVPADALTQLTPYYRFAATLFLTYLGQQVWFAFTKPNTTTTVQVSTPAATPDKTGATAATPSINVAMGGTDATPAPSPTDPSHPLFGG